MLFGFTTSRVDAHPGATGRTSDPRRTMALLVAFLAVVVLAVAGVALAA
ncbi:MAG: hypothetical protein AAGA90_16240 [Actinomycetota bacterium]